MPGYEVGSTFQVEYRRADGVLATYRKLSFSGDLSVFILYEHASGCKYWSRFFCRAAT